MRWRIRGRLMLVAPTECCESPVVAALIQSWVEDKAHPLASVLYFELRESMRNGGGPACLRQRIVLSTAEREAVRARVFFDNALYRELVELVNSHYREELRMEDLADPTLLEESRRALDRLTRLMGLGAVYDFQR